MAQTIAYESVPNEVFATMGLNELREVKAQNFRERPNPFAQDMLSIGAQVEKEGSGVVTWPLETEWHSKPTRIYEANPYAQYDRWAQPTLRPATERLDVCVVQPIFISGYEKMTKRSAASQIDLWRTRTRNVYAHGLEQIQDAVLVGGTASGSWAGVPAFDGLFPINGTDYSSGFVEENASGGNTLHGVSRTSYPVTTHPRLHNLIIDCAASASTTLMDGTMLLQARQRTRGIQSMGGKAKWYCTEAFVKNLGKIYAGKLQYAKQMQGEEQSGLVPVYLGDTLEPVRTLPYNGSASTHDPWSAVRVTWKTGIQFRHYQGGNWMMSKVQDVFGGFEVQGAYFLLFGQMLNLDSSQQALVFDAEAYS